MSGKLQFRHLMLGIALLATLAATFWSSMQSPGSDSAPVAASPRPARSPAPAAGPTPPTGQATDALPPTTLPPRPVSQGEITNLFPRQTWYVAPPPPPAEAPTAPPLPFAYLGKLINNKGIEVYVSYADRNLTLRQGDVIDGIYRVDNIVPPTMSISYLPLKQQQTLEIGRAN